MREFTYYQNYFIQRFEYYIEFLFKDILYPKWGNYFYLMIFLFFIFLVLENTIPWKENQNKKREGVGVDIFYSIFNYILIWFFGGYALCDVSALLFLDFWEINYFDLKVITTDNIPEWVQLILMFILIDFMSYFGHFLLHKVPFLWSFHKVHHAAKELDVLNAGKGHILENFYYSIILYIPLALVGFRLTDVFWVTIVIFALSLYTHCNLCFPIGPFKYIFNNPQMHVWHHEVGGEKLKGVNFGGGLSVWDFIFRTAYLPKDKNPKDLRLGFNGYSEYPKGFIRQQIEPFLEYFRRK